MAASWDAGSLPSHNYGSDLILSLGTSYAVEHLPPPPAKEEVKESAVLELEWGCESHVQESQSCKGEGRAFYLDRWDSRTRSSQTLRQALPGA